MLVNADNINNKIGFSLKPETMADLLTKMSLEAIVHKKSELKVTSLFLVTLFSL